MCHLVPRLTHDLFQRTKFNSQLNQHAEQWNAEHDRQHCWRWRTDESSPSRWICKGKGFARSELDTEKKFKYVTSIVFPWQQSIYKFRLYLRWSNNCQNMLTLKLLSVSLVRPMLEFISFIRNPVNLFCADAFENTLKTFLRFVYYIITGQYTFALAYDELINWFQTKRL